jgi:hypothetical protein
VGISCPPETSGAGRARTDDDRIMSSEAFLDVPYEGIGTENSSETVWNLRGCSIGVKQ